MNEKVRGQDIVELFASDLGYILKSDKFNINEWYGFTNEKGKQLRAKLVPASDGEGNFNVHKWKDNIDGDFDRYCIIQTSNKFTVIKIAQFDGTKFTLNAELNVICGEEKKEYPRLEFDFDDRIYKIKKINQTIYSIRQRVNPSSVIDESAIKKLFDNNKIQKCSYCGIAQEQINYLNEKLIKYNISTYGLTTRERGNSLEIDQINPKQGYVSENMTLSCYWCNNTKSDTFLISEFKEIARGINIAWNKKLKEIGSEDSVCFPENSFIWENKNAVTALNRPLKP